MTAQAILVIVLLVIGAAIWIGENAISSGETSEPRRRWAVLLVAVGFLVMALWVLDRDGGG